MSEKRENDNFTGYQLETGFLTRVRNWRDAIRPMVLIDALRVAGSPSYVLVTLVALLIAKSLLSIEPPAVVGPSLSGPLAWMSGWRSLVPTELNDSTWLTLVRASLAAFVLALPAAISMRAGAIHAAQRQPERLTVAARRVVQRGGDLLLVLVLPWVCVAGLTVPVFIVGMIARLGKVGWWMVEPLSILLLPFIVLIGLIAAGSLVATPLGIAAIAIEKRNDAFDALSRGYEYLYRRPIHLTFYLAVSTMLVFVIAIIANIVVLASAHVVGFAFALASGTKALPYVVGVMLAHLAPAIALTAAWGLIGATYLLLRKDANQQEIEDIAISPIDLHRAELPMLKKKPATEQ